jgi:hypothetical protein
MLLRIQAPSGASHICGGVVGVAGLWAVQHQWLLQWRLVAAVWGNAQLMPGKPEMLPTCLQRMHTWFASTSGIVSTLLQWLQWLFTGWHYTHPVHTRMFDRCVICCQLHACVGNHKAVPQYHGNCRGRAHDLIASHAGRST